MLWYGGEGNEVLVVEAIGGDMIWDRIDSRRGLYDRRRALRNLEAYGECLAQIHSLNLNWPLQKRPRLYGLIGEEAVQNDGFVYLVAWIEANRPIVFDEVFAHGDYNTASVLFKEDSVSGVIDWEFAGMGWREYDLAWALRSRTVFLNTPEEREAILNGYRSHASFEGHVLRWCEVLNYLHFAYWARERRSDYAGFALDRAREIVDQR